MWSSVIFNASWLGTKRQLKFSLYNKIIINHKYLIYMGATWVQHTLIRNPKQAKNMAFKKNF